MGLLTACVRSSFVRCACAMALALGASEILSAGAAQDPPICRGDFVWHHTAPREDRGRLDDWCKAVGPPILINGSSADGARPPASVIVASWNVGVGHGDIASLISVLEGRDPNAAVVLLLQEAYRSSESVPATDRSAPSRIRPPAGGVDVVAIALRFGMSVAYVPSMRNGTQPWPAEDRGNAILSTLPLHEVSAIELPFGRQRRVAVAATVTMPGTPPSSMRFISVHLDTSGDRIDQANALAHVLAERDGAVVAGGDLNSFLGLEDAAVSAISRVIPRLPCGVGRSHGFPGRLDFMFGRSLGRIDHIFGRIDDTRWKISCRTIDSFLGSDHRPVVLELVSGNR